MHKTIQIRILFLMFVYCLIFPVIIFQLYNVQIIQHEKYQEKAERHLERYTTVSPHRGATMDRNGIPLAQTEINYEVHFKLKYFIDKSTKEMHPIKSMDNLSATINTTATSIFQVCKEKYQEVKPKITKNADKFYLNDKPDIKITERHRKTRLYKKHLRACRREQLAKYHCLQKDIPKDMFIKIYCGKKAWKPSKKNKNKIKIVDKYKGFYGRYPTYRKYPYKDLAPHILGNMRNINAKEYKNKKNDYRLIDKVGASGIEKLCEQYLRGQRGVRVRKRFEKNIDEDIPFEEKATDGANVVLTIDSIAQKVAEQELDKMVDKFAKKNEEDEEVGAIGGAAVAIDVKTGEILVLATSPRYDNNLYRKQVRTMIRAPQRPLENRAIYNYFPAPPGSTFKIISSIAVLEEKMIAPSHTIFCRGYLFNPRAFRCTHRHGSVNLRESIAQSCNIYFYSVGEQMGESILVKWAKLFGYGQKVGLGIGLESKGFIPTAAWKQRIGDSWTRGTSRMLAIGQLLEATPLQVAKAMTIVANQGALPRLSLVKGFRRGILHLPRKEKEGEIVRVALNQNNFIPFRQSKLDSFIPISRRTYNVIRQGMFGVVHGPHGTATKIKKILQGIKIASKTGTSQVAGKADHAWFAGFAPAHSPKYAFCVFVENGGYGGSAAAPVAAKMLVALLR